MLLTRAEMTFDFGGARFDLARDRGLLGYIVSQFLYGEVTGIQCGLWLYRAPDLEAASFFARQATEELAHVRSMRRILTMLGAPPEPAHRGVRILARPARTFAEHVLLEMAFGEGLVLMVFYALCDTIPSPEVVRILEATAHQEVRHVAFGEDRASVALRAGGPGLRRRLRAQALVSLYLARRLGRSLVTLAPDHPVLRHLPAFTERAAAVSELRFSRIGLFEEGGPPRGAARWLAMVRGATALTAGRLLPSYPPLLTDTYLGDPAVATPSTDAGDVADSTKRPQ